MHFFPFTGCPAAVHFTWLSNTRLCKCVCVALVGNVTRGTLNNSNCRCFLFFAVYFLMPRCVLVARRWQCRGKATQVKQLMEGATHTNKKNMVAFWLDSNANTMSRRVHPHFWRFTEECVGLRGFTNAEFIFMWCLFFVCRRVKRNCFLFFKLTYTFLETLFLFSLLFFAKFNSQHFTRCRVESNWS